MQTPKYLRTILSLAIIFPAQIRSVMAIAPEPAPKLCNVYFASDTIIRARVLKVTEILDSKHDFIDGYRYNVAVKARYRGRPATRITVESDNSQSRLILKAGQDYMLFAKWNPERGIYNAWAHGNGVQSIDGEPFSQALADKVLDLQRATSSSIEGEIRGKDWELVPNMTFSIAGENQSFDVTSQNDGHFVQVVNPGTYHLQLPPHLEQTIYSVLNNFPESPIVQLRAGQCAQFQFQVK